jgi:riboflavin kinase/FMN adenylyltransferase
MMKVVRGLRSPLPRLAAPVATIGAFDGVHRGHQAVLAETVAWAKELGGEALAVTFDPLPKAVVGAAEALCITSLAHRLLLLGRHGIAVAVVLEFDAALAALPAESFVQEVLLGWLGARRVVLGFNSTFGRRGEGNADLLRRFEQRGLLEVRTPGPVLHRGRAVSSTLIRQAIRGGQLDEAAAMLGRPVALLGTVVSGDRRGRTLGFPTANLDLHHEVAPPPGVYATVAVLDGVRHPALTYIGSRPTFHPEASEPAFEVHLLDLDADLYGRDLEVEFVHALREDERFPSQEALVAQMRADREAARRLLKKTQDV